MLNAGRDKNKVGIAKFGDAKGVMDVNEPSHDIFEENESVLYRHKPERPDAILP